MKPPAEPVLIVGPGAVGGVVAARFALSGRPVLILGRGAPAERTLSRGFTFTGLDGRPRAVRRSIAGARASRGVACAAAVFCVKAQDLPAAARAARPWVGPATAALGLQNGVGHGSLLRRVFGARRAVAGSSYFAADRPAPGRFENSWGNRIVLAAGAGNRDAVRTAGGLLREAGWDVALEASEERLLWTKLCFNAATNPIGAVCGVPNGALAEDPALKELVLAALAEAVAAARRSGIRLLYPDMAGLVLRSCRGAPRQRNSMLQDLAAGRRTEIREILGPLLAAAGRTRTPVPTLSRLSGVVLRLERELGAKA